MDEKTIAQIVEKVFEKAKKEHASHSRYALSNHISDKTNLSSKTLERAYDRYIDKKSKHGAPNAESIDLLCTYLGYNDYEDWAKGNHFKKKKVAKKKVVQNGDGKEKRLVITISIAISIGLLFFIAQRWNGIADFNKNYVKEAQCMTWADSIYVKVYCNEAPLSNYGTKVEPLNEERLVNMKQVAVHAAFKFFSEDGKPLIWYYKNKEGEIEYFTAPGLHPENGKTLRKITPHIIQTYIPVHSNNKDSFLNN